LLSRYVNGKLKASERILFVTRQHWLVLMRSVFVEVTMILVVGAVALGLSTIFPFITGPLALLVVLLLLIVPFIGSLIETLAWWNRQFIVTNTRVMLVSGVFQKHFSEAGLEQVNEVKLHQSVTGRFFNYSDVEISGAVELGTNLIRMMGAPTGFRSAIVNARAGLLE
jgi:uncharacterized membrane protein YdbT with pleckstrin-like domain